MGPAIQQRLSTRDDQQLANFIREGLPTRGMPPSAVPDAEMAAMVAFLRTVERRPPPVPPRTFTLTGGKTITGRVLGEGNTDIQLLADDGRVHLLRRAGAGMREVTTDRDWPSYHGGPDGNRFTPQSQITALNVARLTPAWVFPVLSNSRLQGTPVVAGGIMYVTAPNECIALDAGSGRQIWRYFRPRTPGLGEGGSNRGAGVAGDRVFMLTDNAHVIALNRFTGQLLWDTEMADWHKSYFATGAPLPAGDLVISGVSGGEHGANGFVVAHEQATGREVWRFSTVPKPGERGSETWQGRDLEHGGAPTWFTGSFDPALDLVYWPVGNPSKEYDGADRQGDNLYSDSILALDRRSGTLRWFYQFTPHDLWDWDATEPYLLVDAPWQGRPRKLMLHADRNGFFYVFDRTDGTLLRATPFVTNLTWASGIGADGRPIKLPNQVPSPQGTKVCPSQDGATNWFSTSYDAAKGLLFLQTFEKCSIYTRADVGAWEPLKQYLGGSQRTAADPVPQRVLKAIDLRTGTIKWKVVQPGPGDSWGGTLATAAGLVFYGDETGAFVAADSATGRTLWSFPTNHGWRASPMTYSFDGRQFIAVAAGPNIIAFALPDPRR